MSIFEYVLLNYQWIFICFYLLPVSLFYDVLSFIKNWLINKIYSSPKHHDLKVKHIQKQVRQWIKLGQKAQLCTSRSNCHVGLGCPTYKNSMYNIKMNLIDILEINEEKQTVKVEPFVTMGQLTSKLLPLGWTIPVVPGIDDLTVGGLVLGTGLDSSSHKYGLFHNTCISYEVVLSDGSLIKCSQDENSDLFYSIPWSHGTLGLLTAVEIRLSPASNFVKLQFKAYHNENVAIKEFLKECKNKSSDFVEGLMYNENQIIIVTGEMVNQIEPNRLNQQGKWYKPWFFQHVKSYFIKGFGIEYMPLKDYYYRHTRSAYWQLQDIIPFGNNIFFRMFLGWSVPLRLPLLKLTQAELVKKIYKDQPIMLDVMVPANEFQVAVDTFEKKLGIYPIWLCPLQLNNTLGLVHSQDPDELYINMGIYGVPKAFGFLLPDSLKEVQEFIKKIKGFQMLYGGIYVSENKFKEQFDHSLYDQVRVKLNCQKAFPSLFEKISLIKHEDFYNKRLKDWIL